MDDTASDCSYIDYFDSFKHILYKIFVKGTKKHLFLQISYVTRQQLPPIVILKKSNLLRKITNRTSSIASSASRTRISVGISYTIKIKAVSKKFTMRTTFTHNQSVFETRSEIITDFQNIVYYKDTPLNKAYTLQLFRYIPPPFVDLPICHNIHITVNREHNHSNPAE